MQYCILCTRDMCVICRAEPLSFVVINNPCARDSSPRGAGARSSNLLFGSFSLNIQFLIILQLLALLPSLSYFWLFVNA